MLKLIRRPVAHLQPLMHDPLDLDALPEGAYVLSLEAALLDPEKVLVLDLSDQHIEVLPAEISRLSNLRILSLFGHKLESLPKELGELQQLQEVYLGKDYLVPESQYNNNGGMPKADKLDLESTFGILSNMKSLRFISMRGMYIYQLPLAQIAKLNMPSMLLELPLMRPSRDIKAVRKIMRWFDYQPMPYHARLFFLMMAAGYEKEALDLVHEHQLYGTKAWLYILAYAYDRTIGGKVQQMLEESFATGPGEKELKELPAAESLHITLINVPCVEQKYMQEKLTMLGIQFSDVITHATTHIVVGEAAYQGLEKKYLEEDFTIYQPILLKQQFYQMLQHYATYYLKGQEEEEIQFAKSLLKLLVSSEEHNNALALTMIRSGGLPRPLWATAALLVYQTRKLKFRNELLFAINENTSADFIRVFNDLHLTLKGLPPVDTDHRGRQLATDFEVYFPYIENYEEYGLAEVLYERYGKGAASILENGNSRFFEKIVDGLINEQGILDLSSKSLKKISPDLVAYQDRIKGLILYGNRDLQEEQLLEILTQLPELHTLWLDGESYALLPYDFSMIKQLKTLVLERSLGKIDRNIYRKLKYCDTLETLIICGGGSFLSNDLPRLESLRKLVIMDHFVPLNLKEILHVMPFLEKVAVFSEKQGFGKIRTDHTMHENIPLLMEYMDYQKSPRETIRSVVKTMLRFDGDQPLHDLLDQVKVSLQGGPVSV